MNVVVSDTSPLRALSQLRLLGCLSVLFDEVLIPPAVVAECAVPVVGAPALDASSLEFARIVVPADVALLAVLRSERLGAGESEAIVVAIQTGTKGILIDDAQGRSKAVQMGLRPMGVLGVLLECKRRGLIPAITPLIDALERDISFRIARDVRAAVLALAGE